MAIKNTDTLANNQMYVSTNEGQKNRDTDSDRLTETQKASGGQVDNQTHRHGDIQTNTEGQTHRQVTLSCSIIVLFLSIQYQYYKYIAIFIVTIVFPCISDKSPRLSPPPEKLSPPAQQSDKQSRKNTKSKKPRKTNFRLYLRKNGLKAKGLLLLDALTEAIQKDRGNGRADDTLVSNILHQV